MLRGVAPPAIGMRQPCDELRRRLVEQARPRRVARHAVVAHAPDPALPDVGGQLVLIDLGAEVAARPRPVPLLDDPAVGIDDVDGSVRRGRHIHGTEQVIGRSDELRTLVLIDLTERGETFGVDRPDAADDARDRLAVEIVALQIVRHPVRAHDVVAGGARHAAERQLARPDRTGARLIVPDAGDAPRHFESRLEELLVSGSSAAHGRKRQPVMNRQLKVAGKSAGAALEPDPAGAVLGDAPLRVVRRGGFSQHAVRRPAHAKGVVGAVEPVVQAPEQAALLMLDVAGPAEAGREQLLLVRDRVPVGVGVLPHLVLVRLHRQDRVLAERHHEAREHQLVEEHVVLLVDAVVVGILVHRDAAGWRELGGRVRILHVGADLEDEHAAVPVEGDLHRLFDVRLGQHGFDPVAGRQDEAFLLLGGGHGDDGILRREVCPFERIVGLSPAPRPALGSRRRRRVGSASAPPARLSAAWRASAPGGRARPAMVTTQAAVAETCRVRNELRLMTGDLVMWLTGFARV